MDKLRDFEIPACFIFRNHPIKQVNATGLTIAIIYLYR